MAAELEIAEHTDAVHELDDHDFASVWKDRYMQRRMEMLPDVARWLRILRFWHPEKLSDHWHDHRGVPLPKLAFGEGLSLNIYNMCRPIIEVYGSLLSGQKPLPFGIDVEPTDPLIPSSVLRADLQEKFALDEMYWNKTPLHFMDFNTSMVAFGIGYNLSWWDVDHKRIKTQAIPWPGDVLPLWGSDRYGRGGESLEYVIIQERLSIETAMRLYPGRVFNGSVNADNDMRPDANDVMNNRRKTTLILKIWHRWNEQLESGYKEQIGYSEIAYNEMPLLDEKRVHRFDGVMSGEASVLVRHDKTGYPDIPVRWASRFQIPGQAPHRSAGVLDDVLGLNTEFNEKFSAISDWLMRLAYPKYKGVNFNERTLPRGSGGANVIPLTSNQTLEQLQEQFNALPFDTFLSRLESFVLTNAGLSRLVMGALPPGETSGEALNNLLHAMISRLEITRTPIQYAWVSTFVEIWVPLWKKFGNFTVVDPFSGQTKKTRLRDLFSEMGHWSWIWPDVTPRDSLRAAENAMNLVRAKMLSRETGMKRAQIPSVVDEMQRVRREQQDEVLNPDVVQQTWTARLTRWKTQMTMQQSGTGGMLPVSGTEDALAKLGDVSDNAALKGAASTTPTLDPAENGALPVPPGSPGAGALGGDLVDAQVLGVGAGQRA